jgi:GNAT superfamily N-acetyltransferase
MRARRAFADDPALVERVFSLLDLAFGEDLSGQERAARRLGMRWEDVSTPFCRLEAGELVSHVGVLELPLVVGGRPLAVGGIHAVATHPAHRRRGHYRALIEEALAWCEPRFDALELCTVQPELYEPFGFRVWPEHRFVGAGPRTAGRAGLRPLAYDDPADLARLQRLLSERTPVSRRLGVAGGAAVLLFDEARRPLHLLPDLDAVVSLELEGEVLRLFDVVAREIPPLAEIMARIPAAPARVEVYFAPDRLEAALAAEPHVLNGSEVFMVRGPFPAPAGPAMLPRTARH